jgi:hypothetical protein
MGCHFKRPTDVRTSDRARLHLLLCLELLGIERRGLERLRVCGLTLLLLQPLLFPSKVEIEASAGQYEEGSCSRGENLHFKTDRRV